MVRTDTSSSSARCAAVAGPPCWRRRSRATRRLARMATPYVPIPDTFCQGRMRMISTMPTWTEVTTAAPELAAVVQDRFAAHGLALLATLRRDGAPRISGIEPLFALDEVWLGMMDHSRKAEDLL